MFVSIGLAAMTIGVAISTLRRWEKEKRIEPAFRTKGGHRRYDLRQIQTAFCDPNKNEQEGRNIAYARVSSFDQKSDLERQKKRLESYCSLSFKDFEIIADLGSGLNYQKPGLTKLLQCICKREVSNLILTHRDRLLRFGSPLVFKLCDFFGTKVTILDEQQSNEKTFEEALVADVIEILTVYTAKLHGKRSHENRRRKNVA